MKILIAFMAGFFCFFTCNGQRALATIDVRFRSYDIISDTDYYATVTFRSLCSDTILLPQNDFISDDVSGFGQMMIRFQELNDSCFEPMRIVADKFTPLGWKPVYHTLRYSDSVTYTVNVEQVVGTLGGGFYRLRFIQTFLVNGKFESVESDWKYVHVDPAAFLKLLEDSRKLFNKNGRN